MIGYHVTTDKKFARYKTTGAILPPVRFWPNELTARRWAKRTGRNIILQIEYTQSFPLPDHKPARWTGELIRDFVEVEGRMKETGILFNGEMVRAILDGRKSVTRRVVKPQPEMVFDGESLPDGNTYGGWEPILPPWSKWPYQIGDRLWVRETHWVNCAGNKDGSGKDIIYRADDPNWPYGWRPSIFMPRWASRITLEIVNVRVERLQEITEEDAEKEGIRRTDAEGMRSWPWLGADHPTKGTPKVFPSARQAFASLWDSTTDKHPWSINPYVWVIEFKRVAKQLGGRS